MLILIAELYRAIDVHVDTPRYFYENRHAIDVHIDADKS